MIPPVKFQNYGQSQIWELPAMPLQPAFVKKST